MIYIASPYTSPHKEVRKIRFLQTRLYVGWCMQQGEDVISPIVYGHQFTHSHQSPPEFKYWETFSKSLISACESIRVLKLEGWEKSFGIAEEIRFSRKYKMSIEYVEYDL